MAYREGSPQLGRGQLKKTAEKKIKERQLVVASLL